MPSVADWQVLQSFAILVKVIKTGRLACVQRTTVKVKDARAYVVCCCAACQQGHLLFPCCAAWGILNAADTAL